MATNLVNFIMNNDTSDGLEVSLNSEDKSKLELQVSGKNTYVLKTDVAEIKSLVRAFIKD